MSTRDLIYYGAGAFAATVLIFLTVYWTQNKSVRIRLFVVSLLILSFVSYQSLNAYYARRNIQEFLGQPVADLMVSVNNQPATEPTAVLSTLKNITPYWVAHHSHPTNRIRIDIHSASSKLLLELGRDSGNPREYWIYRRDSGMVCGEIGRITTSLFDQY